MKKPWQMPGLRPIQRLTWFLADFGWQFPEAVRIRYVYWRTKNEWSGPPFPWIRRK